MSIHLQASVKASWDGDALARLTGTAEGLLQSLDCSLQRRKVTKGCWPCRITFDFLSFFTRASTAFSAHFSSSSPCFHPRSFLTAGEVNEKRELRLVMVDPWLDLWLSSEEKDNWLKQIEGALHWPRPWDHVASQEAKAVEVFSSDQFHRCTVRPQNIFLFSLVC